MSNIGGAFNDYFNMVGSDLNVIGNAFHNGVQNIFGNNGILSGNYDSLNQGVHRAVNILPDAFGQAANNYLSGVGSGLGGLLGNLSYQPSFYLLVGGGLLVGVIVLYVLIKV